jgi:hypothetical protein
MLIRVAVRAPGTAASDLQGTVIARPPEVAVGSAPAVFPAGPADTEFFNAAYKVYVLCYAVHTGMGIPLG